MTFVENTVTKQNVMNRDLFRIDPSSYISPCYFSLVLTAFYGKIMVPTNVAKFWLRTSKNKVYRKCQQIDPAFDSQGKILQSFWPPVN